MSSVKEYVTQFFNEYITESFQNSEVKNFLLTHERKQICIDNLSRELKRAEYKMITLDIILLKKTVRDFAKLFCGSALDLKKQELWSETKKITEQRKADEIEEFKKELDKEEAGVETLKFDADPEISILYRPVPRISTENVY